MSKQVITFKKKNSITDQKSNRRVARRQREQAARRQRWMDANEMIKAVLSNILTHDEDRYIRSQFEQLCRRVTASLKAKQSDEQIILKAIRAGHHTSADIQCQTGFTSEVINPLLDDLISQGKVIFEDDHYRSIQN